MPDTGAHLAALHAAWDAFGDPRSVTAITEASPKVSTNEVYRLALDDGSRVYGKVSSYGSYFLFAEDHDRLFRCTELLQGTRFAGFLAPVLGHGERPYTWYDGRLWVAFYDEVAQGRRLPATLDDAQVEQLGREIADFHRVCSDIAPALPPTSNSVKSDAVHLLDLLSSPFAPRNYGMPAEQIGVLWRHTHELLLRLEALRYDAWPRIPILVDWNLGNFSVVDQPDGSFRLFTRWDYDWFRLETRLHDFYFLSRVSSATGDRTSWTYSPHTLVEPRFARFVRCYHEVFPLTEADIAFLPDAYLFFVLNYVVREGARFFRPDLCERFRREAVRVYLPALANLDISPLLAAVR
ncbi:MAG: hypothetical protein WAS51_16800 [Ilumatobacteraceae bacterium]|nr:MAG: hypothetical protein IPM43_00225 [Actinomycetota bacterium]